MVVVRWRRRRVRMIVCWEIENRLERHSLLIWLSSGHRCNESISARARVPHHGIPHRRITLGMMPLHHTADPRRPRGRRFPCHVIMTPENRQPAHSIHRGISVDGPLHHLARVRRNAHPPDGRTTTIPSPRISIPISMPYVQPDGSADGQRHVQFVWDGARKPPRDVLSNKFQQLTGLTCARARREKLSSARLRGKETGGRGNVRCVWSSSSRSSAKLR